MSDEDVSVRVAGVLTFDGDYVPHVEGKSLAELLAPLEGRNVLVDVTEVSEPRSRVQCACGGWPLRSATVCPYCGRAR